LCFLLTQKTKKPQDWNAGLRLTFSLPAQSLLRTGTSQYGARLRMRYRQDRTQAGAPALAPVGVTRPGHVTLVFTQQCVRCEERFDATAARSASDQCLWRDNLDALEQQLSDMHLRAQHARDYGSQASGVRDLRMFVMRYLERYQTVGGVHSSYLLLDREARDLVNKSDPRALQALPRDPAVHLTTEADADVAVCALLEHVDYDVLLRIMLSKATFKPHARMLQNLVDKLEQRVLPRLRDVKPGTVVSYCYLRGQHVIFDDDAIADAPALRHPEVRTRCEYKSFLCSADAEHRRTSSRGPTRHAPSLRSPSSARTARRVACQIRCSRTCASASGRCSRPSGHWTMRCRLPQITCGSARASRKTAR